VSATVMREAPSAAVGPAALAQCLVCSPVKSLPVRNGRARMQLREKQVRSRLQSRTPTAKAGPPSIGEFDYIVVGAGSAGCVLANRLSGDPACRVLLVEAGGEDNWIWLHIPAGYLRAIGDPRADWLLMTESEAGLGGRQVNYPRGKVLGGSSAINGMIYMRGQAADYDGWRQLGLTGWGWDDVLPLFKHHEDYFRGADDFHGSGGEWRIEAPRIRWELLDRIEQACVETGIPRTEDFNRGDNEGVSYFQVNQ